MTIKELNNYSKLIAERKELQLEIDSLYDSRKSPSLDGSGGHGTTPSNPTEKAFYEIERMREKNGERINEINDITKPVEEWINSLDPRMRTIVGYRFKLRWRWPDINKAVNGTYSMYQYNARKEFMRFMGKEK